MDFPIVDLTEKGVPRALVERALRSLEDSLSEARTHKTEPVEMYLSDFRQAILALREALE